VSSVIQSVHSDASMPTSGQSVRQRSSVASGGLQSSPLPHAAQVTPEGIRDLHEQVGQQTAGDAKKIEDVAQRIQFEADSVGDSEAKTVNMQSVHGDSSLSTLRQQARRMTSGTGDRLQPSTCPLTAEEICEIIRNRRQRFEQQRGFLPGSRAATESRESVYSRVDRGQSGATGQELTGGHKRNLETGRPSDYHRVAGEQPLSKMVSSGQRNNQLRSRD